MLEAYRIEAWDHTTAIASSVANSAFGAKAKVSADSLHPYRALKRRKLSEADREQRAKRLEEGLDFLASGG